MSKIMSSFTCAMSAPQVKHIISLPRMAIYPSIFVFRIRNTNIYPIYPSIFVLYIPPYSYFGYISLHIRISITTLLQQYEYGGIYIRLSYISLHIRISYSHYHAITTPAATSSRRVQTYNHFTTHGYLFLRIPISYSHYFSTTQPAATSSMCVKHKITV